MGIAAYNRGSKALSQEIDRDVAAIANRIELRAGLWAKCLDLGYLLTWRKQGFVITASQRRTARGCEGFFAIVWKRRSAPVEIESRTARDLAFQITRYVGRLKPVEVSRL